MKTEIVNETIHTLIWKEGGAGIFKIREIPPTRTFTITTIGLNQTYREYFLEAYSTNTAFNSDDLVEAEVITVYETIEGTIAWRISKARGSLKQPSANIQSVAAFAALTGSAQSRIEVMETSCEDLRDALKQVKVCPAQCQNLVQTCLDGTMKLKWTYSTVPENEMWQLYDSKKLPHLINSLIRLLSTLGSSKDLLQACGSEWGRMALVLSVPPSAKKTLSKFDILINELSWNLDTIYHALQLTGDMEFKWNDSSCRYVYEKKPMSRSWLRDGMLQSTKDEILSPKDMELYEKSEVLVCKDREHLLRNLQNGLLLTPENYVPDLSSLRDYFSSVLMKWLGFKPKEISEVGKYFSSVLMKRLEFKPEEISEVGKDLNPECFRVNQKDLKFRKLLYEASSKSVYKGDWCGQTVAIGVTRGAEEEHVKREAAVILKLQHPNIIDFLGWSFTEDAQPPVKSDKSESVKPVSAGAGYLVMEWMPEGNLREAIDLHVKTSGSSFDLVVGVDVLLQIAGAMVHMHNHDLMHRDLKAANCLVEGRSSLESNSLKFFTVKLIDFETSKEDDPNASIVHHTLKTGTTYWRAPEVIWGNSGNLSWPCTPYTRSADVYSFGMVCYEVISGLTPFQNELDKEIFKKSGDVYIAVANGQRPMLPPCPKSLEELVVKCWAQNPSARPIFKDIQKSLWTIKKELELQ